MRYAITITLYGAALYLAWTFHARRAGLYDSWRRTGAEAAVRGSFWVAPRQTAHYRLTAVGTRSRKADRELTVAVP